MLEKIAKDKKFARIMKKHIEDVIQHFFQTEQNFGILCRIEDTTFDPPLPAEMLREFRSLTLFFLAGYTFETAQITDGTLVFEAGFGSENFGSVVEVPLLSILQIIVDETPVFINLSTYKEEIQELKQEENQGVQNSMQSFLSNPENSKFFKK